MKSGTNYKQGEIILVPFPFSDLNSIRQRPALIISKNKDISKSDDIITCGVTSNLKNSENSVLIYNNNLEGGKIPVESRIKVDKLFTLDKRIIKKKIAILNKEKFNEVKKIFINLI